MAEETGGDGRDKRRHPRAPLSLLIQFRFDSLDEFMSEYAIDISYGGMFIRTLEPREEGSMVYLQFSLKGGARLIEGLGRVVRVNPPASSQEPGMGIEFVNFDDQSMALIEDIVRKNLAKTKG